MKTIANALTLAIVVLASGCATENSVLYRSSSDKKPPSLEVLYISPFVAMTKNSYGYSIGFAHWLNDPELAENTGDIFDKSFGNSISLIGQSKSKGLLVGQGYNPNPENWPGTIYVNSTTGLPESQKPRTSETGYFIITFDRILFFETENEMNNYLHKIWNISTIKLEPAGVFFEKTKRNRHQPNS
ncbi:MAG TPA: hypothetical protein VK769_02505, partial [Verrucomicrobiae bacterium]|nr:hypothetical protein [Verrucomicrobiae bacterium]